MAQPTRSQIERLLAGGFHATLIKCSEVYVWERCGRLYSALAALELLEGTDVPKDETVEITRELLEKGRGADGSWTPAQLQLLGVESPPPRGWRHDLRGKRISREDADAFIELRDNSQRDLFGGGNG